MNVDFVSRERAKALVSGSEDFSVISINTLETQEEEMKQHLSHLSHWMTCVFLDLDGEDSGFSEETATSILKFAETCFADGKKNILVHCDMGVSRSGAVAKWVNDYFGLGNLFLDGYTLYNRTVYNTLCKVSGIQTMSEFYKNLENPVDSVTGQG